MTGPKINDGGEAFACASEGGHQPGMSLRDWFAGNFMAAMLCQPEAKVNVDLDNGVGFKQAQTAYLIADAMIRARGEQEPF